MKKIFYNDGMLERKRSKREGFILNGEFIPFHEAEERKVAVIKELRHVKKGEWSFSEFEIYTNSATFVMGYRPWDDWPEDEDMVIDHIVEINKNIGNEITREEARIFMENAFSKLWERIVGKENKLKELM